MVRIQAISFEFTYRSDVSGSYAAPPHSAPPSKPGKITVPCRLPGMNCPSLLTSRKRASAAQCASGVRVVSISAVRRWRAKGSGSRGRGCSPAVISPSRSEGGTLRYSIGNSGRPLARSNR